MGLVDRWLSKPSPRFQENESATSATSATLRQNASISAPSDVANRMRRPATSSARAPIRSPIVSQSVASGLRQEKPQNFSRARAMSQMSQMSQEMASAEWGEGEEERTAIVENDGKIPLEWAEGFAWLDPDRPPGDVPLRRWQRFVDDAGLFLDSSFCALAAALGWRPYDLFGADRDRPFALDQCGLLWLLNGDRLVMLSQNMATTVETRTGARQTWRRKPREPGRVLAWELAPQEHAAASAITDRLRCL